MSFDSIVNTVSNMGQVGSVTSGTTQGILTNKQTNAATEGVPFSSYLNEAVSNVAGSDYVDKLTNVGLVTGTIDNLHTATIAGEKAAIMLNLTVQVRNRMVEGYQEIMRMQM